jgi:hypothetical protein
MSKRKSFDIENIEVEEKSKKVKRSEADIRNEHLDEGAILIEFTPHKSASKQIVEWWRSMEKFGFKFTDDGCMIPHKQYWGSKGGNEEKGKPTRPSCRSISYQFFNGKEAQKNERNKEGWPCDEQYSHLCHVWNCASQNCIIVEEQWKNLKRNYCGLKGECDCNNDVKCTRTYHNSEWDWDFDYLGYDTPNLKSEIQKFWKDYKFKILAKNHYQKEDEKRKNRNIRVTRGKKQK